VITTVFFKDRFIKTKFKGKLCLKKFFCCKLIQQRQFGLKSGGRGSGSTKFSFFQANFREISIFQAISQKNSIFPGKFLKNFDFSRQIFEKFLLF